MTEGNNRVFQFFVGCQVIGLIIASYGLGLLPVGDNMFEVPNDRLQLVWFSVLWCAVSAGLSVLGKMTSNPSILLLAVVLMSVSSTIALVTTNFFNGFTRVCWQCAGEEYGQPCPDFIHHCQDGRVAYLIGAALQIGAQYALMFLSQDMRHSIMTAPTA